MNLLPSVEQAAIAERILEKGGLSFELQRSAEVTRAFCETELAAAIDSRDVLTSQCLAAAYIAGRCDGVRLARRGIVPR